MTRNFKIAFMTSVSMLVMASPVLAAAEQKPQTVDEVVVTGSRLVKDGTKAPTPVTVLTSAELLNKAPNNIADGINQLPQFVNSQGANAGGAPFTNGARTASYLNLRNLGFQRSLVLLNGQRLAPTSFEGAVDTNTLPQALVQRVDVVTGGASAVYGSDALSGVVNFVLDTKFTGLKMSAQAGLSSYNDLASQRVSVAGGTSFLGGRAHFVGSLDWFSKGGIYDSQRPYGKDGYYLGGTGTAANPFRTLSGVLSFTAPTSMRIVNGPLGISGSAYFFDVGGFLRPYNYGTSTGNPSSQIGGDGGQQMYTGQHMTVPDQNNQVFARTTFDLTDTLSAYTQVGYAFDETKFGSYHNIWNGGSAGAGFFIFTGNAFLTPQAQALMTANGVNSFTFSRSNNPDDTRIPAGGHDYPVLRNHQTTEVKRFAAGLEGSVFGDWKWDANYSYGWSRFLSKDREPYLPKVVAALDAVKDGSGNIVCNVTLTNPGLYPGCVPLNLMGYGAPSLAAINYTMGIDEWSVVNTLHVVNANVRGSPFSVWAGPVQTGFGAEYRLQTLDQYSNGDPTTHPDKTGLRGAPSGLTFWGTNNVGTTHGRVNVKEAYAEITVPLLKDLPLVQTLDLNGAYRYTDYSTAGAVRTWKASLIWAPIDDIRFRATSSVDIRAPTLNELFAGTQSSQQITTDPHTGVTGVISSRSGGNPKLVPELGNTMVLGAVYRPSWFPGFSLSVDRYSILIANQIATPSVLQNLADCETSGGTSPACSLIVRPNAFSDHTAANFPTLLITGPVNISKLWQQGYDIEASYRFDANRISSNLGGTFEVRALASDLPERDTRLNPSSPKLKTAGYSVFPKLRGSISVNYQGDKLGVFVQERATGSYNLATSPGAQFYADHGVAPNIWYTDMTLTYGLDVMSHKSQAFLSINNLMGTKPPILAQTTGTAYPTNPGVYDTDGRYFTLGLRVKY